MQFLNPFTSTKRTSGNLPQSSDDEDVDDASQALQEEETQPSRDDGSVDGTRSQSQRDSEDALDAPPTPGQQRAMTSRPTTPSPSVSSASSFGKRRRKELSVDPVSDRVMQYLESSLKQTEEHKEEPDDADKHFLLSLLPTLKRLDARANSGVKIKIQQLLHDAEYPPAPPPPPPAPMYHGHHQLQHTTPMQAQGVQPQHDMQQNNMYNTQYLNL